MIQLDEKIDTLSQEYVKKWFISKDTLARRVGITLENLEDLLKVQCAPSIIYSQQENKEWWDALNALMTNSAPFPPKKGISWYSTGAVWWLRRARFYQQDGLTALQASAKNKAFFIQNFCEQLASISHAHIAYPTAFSDKIIYIQDTAHALAISEWENWICGAFAVCLPYFTANTCIRKEVLATRIRLAHQGKQQLSSLETFNLSEELASLILPFAPWQRKNGTPGKTIDPMLSKFQLGTENPYA